MGIHTQSFQDGRNQQIIFYYDVTL